MVRAQSLFILAGLGQRVSESIERIGECSLIFGVQRIRLGPPSPVFRLCLELGGRSFELLLQGQRNSRYWWLFAAAAWQSAHPCILSASASRISTARR